MPLVDYRCDSCGSTQEVFAASPVIERIRCPQCDGTARRRYGLAGLLGVRPARKAKDQLDKERATQAPMDAAGRQRLRDHQHGHDHHQLQHDHDHQSEEHP